jgi:hypothetical protein
LCFERRRARFASGGEGALDDPDPDPDPDPERECECEWKGGWSCECGGNALPGGVRDEENAVVVVVVAVITNEVTGCGEGEEDDDDDTAAYDEGVFVPRARVCPRCLNCMRRERDFQGESAALAFRRRVRAYVRPDEREISTKKKKEKRKGKKGKETKVGKRKTKATTRINRNQLHNQGRMDTYSPKI